MGALVARTKAIVVAKPLLKICYELDVWRKKSVFDVSPSSTDFDVCVFVFFERACFILSITFAFQIYHRKHKKKVDIRGGLNVRAIRYYLRHQRTKKPKNQNFHF